MRAVRVFQSFRPLLFLLVLLLVVRGVSAKGKKRHSADPPPTDAPLSLEDLKAYGNGPLQWADDNYIHKTHFSNTSRVVFVVGVGGTGHHAMGTVFAVCEEAGTCYDADFRKELWNQRAPTHVEKRGLFNINRGKYNGNWTNGNTRRAVAVAASMQAFAAAAGKRGSGLQLQVANTIGHDKTGCLSYPNFDKSSVARKMQPDVRMLAAIAEQEGIDFRAVVMLRDPLAAATSVGRRFWNKCTKCVLNTGMNAIEQLRKQLALLDPRFFSCTYLHRLRDFGPSLDRLLLDPAAVRTGSFQTWVPDVINLMNASNPDAPAPPGMEGRVEKMREIQARIQTLCSATTVPSLLRANFVAHGGAAQRVLEGPPDVWKDVLEQLVPPTQ